MDVLNNTCTPKHEKRCSTLPKYLPATEASRSPKLGRPKALLKSFSTGMESNVTAGLKNVSSVGRKIVSVLPWSGALGFSPINSAKSASKENIADDKSQR